MSPLQQQHPRYLPNIPPALDLLEHHCSPGPGRHARQPEKCYQKSDNVRLLKQLQTLSKQQKSDYFQHLEQSQTISTTIVWFNIFKLFLLNTSAAAKSSANSALAAATFGDHNFLLRAIQSYKSFKRKPLKSNIPSTNLDTKTDIHYNKTKIISQTLTAHIRNLRKTSSVSSIGRQWTRERETRTWRKR